MALSWNDICECRECGLTWPETYAVCVGDPEIPIKYTTFIYWAHEFSKLPAQTIGALARSAC
jgi:hypothetical protein